MISATFAAFLLPSRLGTVPFPISALISGLLNAALVWAGLHCTTSRPLAAISVWTFLLTVAGFTLGGPGGDNVLVTAGLGSYGVLVLMVLGVAPPVVVLRHALSR